MTGRPEDVARAPYVGLRPFEFHEAELFYGRGEHIVEMVRTLRNGHLLAVIGSSGSGKSSLVRAGLLPAIAARFMDVGDDDLEWRFVIMRPGREPYENLLLELLPKLAPGQSLDPDIVEFRRQTLRGGPRGLVEAVADSLLPESTRLVVVVDQFEEIFRVLERGDPSWSDDASSVADQRNAALAFVDMLLATAAEHDPRVYVVLTMRSEYLGDCEAFLGLSAAIAKSQFLTPRMTREQVEDVIARPVAAVGGQIEPQAVTTLLNSLGTAQDQLPRVEHVLLQMWNLACEAREKQADLGQPIVLTLDDYRAAGRFESALDQHAEQLYDELGIGSEPGQPSERQRVAERLFRSLAVRTPQGTLARRLSSLGEVASIAGASEEIVAEVVEHFRQPGCNFLVITPSEPLTGKTTLDISHESLLRQWRRMGDWVTAEADAAAQLQRIVRDAQSWHEKERGFLRQPELGLYARWRHQVPSPTWALRYVTAEEFSLADEYLDASTREALAEERGARRRLLVTGVALVIAVIIGASFGTRQAWVAMKLKEDVAEKSIELELATADANRDDDEWAIRLAHLDSALSYSGAARYSKRKAGAAAALWAELRYGAASRAPLVRRIVDNKSTIQRMAWSPKEAVLATAGNEVLLWSFPGKESADVSPQSCDLTGSSSGDVSSLRFSADGKVLIVRRDKRWEIVSVAKKKLIFTCPSTELLLDGDPFSPDGTQAVSRIEGGRPHIIRTEVPDDPGVPPSIIPMELPKDPGVEPTGLHLNGGVVAWSPNGDRIALADEKRMISVYSISKTGATLLLPKAFEAFADVAALRAATKTAIEVKELSFDASGKFLLVKDEKGLNPLFEIWAVDSTGAERRDRATAKFRAWIPNRSLLLHMPLGDGPAVILKAPFQKGRDLPIKDPSQPQFRADGPEVLFVQSKRNYQVLNLETGYPVTPPFGWWTGPITARVSLYPTLTASLENKTHLAFWDLRPKQPRWRADPPQPQPVAPVWSPDKKWIADIMVDQHVQVAPSDDNEHPSVVISLDEQPSTIGWSENGRCLRIYSSIRGYIDLEWDPPTEIEEPVHKLVQLLVAREHDDDKTIPEKRFKLRQEMPKWKAKDPRWQRLLDWWNAGRPNEPPGPNARLITDPPSDDAISSTSPGRDPPTSKWVFHDSNTRPLTPADLRGLSDDDLWRARNEIYIRRGVNLKGDKARKLVESFGSEFHDSGIKPDPAYDLMNGVEKANIMLIKSVESQTLIGQ